MARAARFASCVVRACVRVCACVYVRVRVCACVSASLVARRERAARAHHLAGFVRVRADTHELGGEPARHVLRQLGFLRTARVSRRVRSSVVSVSARGGSDSRRVEAAGAHIERDALAHVALRAHVLRACLGTLVMSHKTMVFCDPGMRVSSQLDEAGMHAAHARPVCGARARHAVRAQRGARTVDRVESCVWM